MSVTPFDLNQISHELLDVSAVVQQTAWNIAAAQVRLEITIWLIVLLALGAVVWFALWAWMRSKEAAAVIVADELGSAEPFANLGRGSDK